MATTTFSGPVVSTNGFTGVVTAPTYTVATAPSAVDAGAGAMIYVSNGAAGAPTLAVSNGTDWYGSNGLAIAIA